MLSFLENTSLKARRDDKAYQCPELHVVVLSSSISFSKQDKKVERIVGKIDDVRYFPSYLLSNYSIDLNKLK
jgi:hypothetical protein